MPSIIKKTKKGKAYYYAVQCKRVNGKPRIAWQKYLGSVEAIIKRSEQNLAPLPTETVLFEAGGVAALLSIATRLGLIDLINRIVPKRDQGPSVGHYVVLAALNRALDPLSKSQIGDWYHNTVLQRLWGFSSEVFNSQRYWDHMDMISEDSIDKIQNFLTERARKEFSLETQSLLYDTTNFFTHIDTHNNRNTIAQRGKNKQKRADLRQVNLALLTTRDFQIPLFHKAYEGNTPDIKFFPEVVTDLLSRHSAVFGPLSDATLVFDKGNFSEESKEQLLYSGTYFVAGLKAEVHPEIFAAPIDQFENALTMPGTKFYESTIEVHGKSCKAVVSYSESFFTQQLASLSVTMTKCQERLKELHGYLLSWTNEKKPKGSRPTKAKVKEKLKQILSPQHMESVFTVNLVEVGNLPCIHYSVNRQELDKITATRLGRTLLLTNRQSWLPTEIITTYRDLANIEEAFKNMKNRDYLRWQPAFHWTDQKIKAHSLYCVIALLLATLARKMAWEAGQEVSLPALLDDLSAMKEVALLYSDQGNKLKAHFTMNSMTPRQKKFAEIFGIGEILVAG
jgi:transposase